MENGIYIEDVQAGSLAEEVGIQPGDYLLSVNCSYPRDILEYKEAILASQISLEYRDSNGQTHQVTLAKDPYTELGLSFATSLFNGVRRCQNNCQFCFVRQLPQGLRASLYVKDDDYRLSFLEGSFVTLTNWTEEDYQRVISSRLSPLYISVHTLNPVLRRSLMGNHKSSQIKENLERLAAAGIQYHLQLVLIPGVNDGVELERSIQEIGALGSACLSLGAVPVGLTQYREGLPLLRTFTGEEAGRVIETIKAWQARFYQERGQRLIYAADEFYLLANLPIPRDQEYEGYPQLENGIGLVRLFWDSFTADFKPPSKLSQNYLLVTGVSGVKALQPIYLALPSYLQGQIRLVTVPNKFLGESVTVTGLLGGKDIVNTLMEWRQHGYGTDWTVIIPKIIFNQAGLTLDGWKVENLIQKSGFSIKIIDQTGSDLAKLLSESRRSRYARWLNG